MQEKPFEYDNYLSNLIDSIISYFASNTHPQEKITKFLNGSSSEITRIFDELYFSSRIETEEYNKIFSDLDDSTITAGQRLFNQIQKINKITEEIKHLIIDEEPHIKLKVSIINAINNIEPELYDKLVKHLLDNNICNNVPECDKFIAQNLFQSIKSNYLYILRKKTHEYGLDEEIMRVTFDAFEHNNPYYYVQLNECIPLDDPVFHALNETTQNIKSDLKYLSDYIKYLQVNNYEDKFVKKTYSKLDDLLEQCTQKKALVTTMTHILTSQGEAINDLLDEVKKELSEPSIVENIFRAKSHKKLFDRSQAKYSLSMFNNMLTKKIPDVSLELNSTILDIEQQLIQLQKYSDYNPTKDISALKEFLVARADVLKIEVLLFKKDPYSYVFIPFKDKISPELQEQVLEINRDILIRTIKEFTQKIKSYSEIIQPNFDLYNWRTPLKLSHINQQIIDNLNEISLDNLKILIDFFENLNQQIIETTHHDIDEIKEFTEYTDDRFSGIDLIANDEPDETFKP